MTWLLSCSASLCGHTKDYQLLRLELCPTVPSTYYPNSDPSFCGVAHDLTLPGSLLWLIHRYLLFLPPLNFHPTIVSVLESSSPTAAPPGPVISGFEVQATTAEYPLSLGPVDEDQEQ